MKPHFGKEIIEAPRHGSRSANSAKVRHYGLRRFTGNNHNDTDHLEYNGPIRLPVSRKQEGYNNKLGYKSFSDVLGPLRNYLRRNCGRLWNDVYSEIAYNLGRFTKKEGLRHIISAHLDVATNTWRGESGKIYNDGDRGPEIVSSSYRTEFYVEPETGILRTMPEIRTAKRTPKPVEVISLGLNKEYHNINGIWFYQEYTKTETKIYNGRSPLDGTPRYAYVDTLTITYKKQLNKKELRELAKLL